MRQAHRRVVVTGMGTVSPLGFDCHDVYDKMLRGESGIRVITSWDTTACPCKIGGTV
jgi:3-oxoacyl-[acyl-carrier-protein] synthase II